MNIQQPSVQYKGMLPTARAAMMQITDSVTFEVADTCEACDSTLTVFCVLKSKKVGNKIRVGVCPHCGYIGYVDKPSKSWIVDFYSKDWDKEFSRTVDDIKSNYELPKGKIKGSRHTAFMLHKQLPVNFDRPFLEVGSGYGQVMKHFYEAGFKEVYGVENSGLRAERVNKAFGFKIYQGAFGSPELSEALSKHAPFSLVFSHHVLEHTYHPKEVIWEIGKLQKEGDLLILSLPNCSFEHILYQVLYLPHLHGFTPESLEIVLNKCGYELIIDDRGHDTSIIFAAVKKHNPQPRIKLQDNYVQQTKQRLVNALQADLVDLGDQYELMWEQKAENTDFSAIQKEQFPRWISDTFWSVKSVFWYIKTRFLKRFHAGYRMRLIKEGVSEIAEITFPEQIELMIK